MVQVFVRTPNWYTLSYHLQLTSVIPSNNITSIERYVFEGCESLTSINIPNKVTSIKMRAFYNCILLSDMQLPNGLIEIEEQAFYNCSSLHEIIFPDCLLRIGKYAFDGCDNLTRISIFDSINHISSYAFHNCNKLSEIIIPGHTHIGDYPGESPFDGCTSISYIKITGVGDMSISVSAICKDSKSDLIAVDIGNGVTSIGNYSFLSCNKLTNILIPNNVGYL